MHCLCSEALQVPGTTKQEGAWLARGWRCAPAAPSNTLPAGAQRAHSMRVVKAGKAHSAWLRGLLSARHRVV